MNPGEYNFNAHRRGDTLEPVVITLTQTDDDETVAIDLTGCSIEAQFKKKIGSTAVLTLSTDNAYIVITDDEGGEITIGDTTPIPLDIEPATYYYDMQFTFPSGAVRTYLAGTLEIQADVTR